MRIPTIEFDEKDLFMCGLVMDRLFEKIARAHGEEATRGMFDLYAPRLKDREFAFRKNVELVLEYLLMPLDRRSVPKLADRLASENEKIATKKSLGSKGQHRSLHDETANLSSAQTRTLSPDSGGYRVQAGTI